MATKAELLAALDADPTFTKRAEPEVLDYSGSVTWYRVWVLEVGANDRALRRELRFYVSDEGTGEEQAFYERDVPGPSIDNTVLEAINSYLAGINIYFFQLVESDLESDNKYIIIDAYEQVDASTATTNRYFVYKMAGMPISHRLLQ